ncbi:tetratricopeptide repeat protein [Macrococcus equipercicus]|uniref:Tetratricopeptide repeat protein n=1 Tax=Macrococcus equipercicus TaxID=69967 RepID=A0A9Q9BPG2_9STAP|nr:tetratricopeptide repeat protein [Macrococcus equipercicus]KAA1040029.1 tetratricopeptide repeat protein [Macrococcus equipercicus]UTH13039.1 tetratricopeptide repeat protein [Macrococcus equipercicus]
MNEQYLIELIQQKKYEQALAMLFKAIEENPDEPNHYINAGTILADAGKVEEAERFFRKALTLDAEHSGAYYGLANIYFNYERYTDAVPLYQKALAVNNGDADIHYMLGMSFINSGDFQSALPYMMRSYELKPADDEVAFQYGLLLCQLSMYEEAVSVLDALLAGQPEHTDALYNIALARYMTDDDAARALETFHRVTAIQPDHLLAGHAITMFEQLKEE